MLIDAVLVRGRVGLKVSAPSRVGGHICGCSIVAEPAGCVELGEGAHRDK
jgi:hypothetical protein